MTKYREILRLKGLGFSERNIALSVPCSRSTVSKVLKRAEKRGISWLLLDSMTDGDLENNYLHQRQRLRPRGCQITPTSARNF